MRALRGPLRRLLTADRDAAVEIVNTILAEHRAVPQLVRHDGFDYHVHAVGRDVPLADRIAVETAMAMVDLSRNRSRRFCSVTCGNRVAAAAYRARRG